MSEQRDLLAGRYRLQHRIGSGGMGHVWLAWDERLSRAVAVKQLRGLADLPEEEATVAHQRAMREARITARLDHPNAVPVFDVVDHDGQPCLVMQYVPSRSLQEVLRAEGTLAPVRVARIGSEVASALTTAHEARIVHRDVKPGNILVTPDGTALITDFGISRAFGDTSLTSTGMLTGTPAYLAPEVARGASSTPAADVFSLGATLYAAVEGTPPFGAGDNPMALLHKVASGTIDPPRLAGALSGVLLAMLHETPALRPTMREAWVLLARLDDEDGVPAAPGGAVPTTRVLPVAAATGIGAGVGTSIGIGAGAGGVLGDEGGHTVELPSDPPEPEGADALAPLASGAAAGTASSTLTEPAPAAEPASAPDPATVPTQAPTPAREGDRVDPARRRRRGGLLAGALVLLLLGAWGVQRMADSTGEAAPAPRAPASTMVPRTPSTTPSTSPSTSAAAAPTTAAATSAVPSSRAPAQAAPTRTRTTAPAVPRATAPAATTPPPTTAPVAPPAPSPAPSSPTATTDTGAATASELSAAVRDYYRVLPQNTDAGWARLTDRYRQTTATSRSYYDRFWGSIDRVQVSQVSSQAPSSVVATLRYDYADGRVFIERTSYTLVRQGGQLKIDRSAVLSSRQS